MEALKQAHRALCAYGELKRQKAAGGEHARAFMARISKALSSLGEEDQMTIQALYIRGMTQEETAWAVNCDPSTVSRRKRRALERLALILYPDQYLRESGLHK